ncbi:MAG: hypothetical protein KTR33_17075 [Gammaproteobacteria bacterium]|nr:hypothetical protein [Gammaproteobacteria bacterium]
MLPMGTIVAVLMLVGALFATRLPVLGRVSGLSKVLSLSVGVLVAAGGAWNVFWYALQNISEFWGQMALLSGVFMLATGALLINPSWLPAHVQVLRPVITLGVFLFGVFYAWTIYNL